jgi:peptidoglycan/LPS O-acetylase OafA/YrhL
MSSYCFGAVFWCAGLWLAWYGKPLASTGDARAKLPWVSIGLLFLATVQYRLFFNVMDHFGYGWPKHSQLSFVNLQIFPLSFIILAGATSRIVPRIWWPLALVQPLAMVTYSAWSGDPHRFLFDDAGIGNVMTLLAMILWPLKLSNRWLVLICPVGLISYGIYIFQAPAINFVELHWPTLMAEPLSFLVRFAVIVLLTLLIAYLTERILQPKIRRWLDAHLKPLLAAKPVAVAAATKV